MPSSGCLVLSIFVGVAGLYLGLLANIAWGPTRAWGAVRGSREPGGCPGGQHVIPRQQHLVIPPALGAEGPLDWN